MFRSGKHLSPRRASSRPVRAGRGVVIAAVAASLFATPALADHGYANSNPTTRQTACRDLDTGDNVTATYQAGGVADARCEVVSVATTVEETTEQVNNERAARAVIRTRTTTTEVTTTQLYKWDSGHRLYVADGDPLTEEGQALVEECMITPGIEKCA